ncbi:hypothetical protein KC332_g2305 [Hortaea werneckii]|uniref:CNH domain-containing protein n=2 Tax=Hortaea werneckii TaxID=91943 RepID=A0A3M7JAH2_HORWE|nr:hypothetical protein KC358_g2356 [Hortaea werneckii]OTA32632.1 hypothetical protein BTJ68_07917 [Hortaea werneckii EXF-2000]KAI6944302.1 hypothetical protein KC341_g918 [Hortaea werneckii]KAI6950080.1 hypothetical protein KC348_g890 [Hortaea werneckii]KAI6983222.1 hypothetical protein KC321_g200 [Hortaea werneckii]
MLSAFRPQPIHELKPKDKSKIESLLAYGDRLLVGLNTGCLRIYRVNETEAHSSDQSAENGDPQTSSGKVKPVELLREEDKFSRKAVQQLAIIKEANLLASLSDGYVSLHDLQTYQLSERIERTRGASCFSVMSNVVKDAETGVPSLVSRLAVGVKRRIMVWTWRDMELEEHVIELNVEGTTKSLNWVHAQEGGSNALVKLVVGVDAGFIFVDIETEEQVPVSKPVSRQDATSGELAGVRFGAVSSSGMGYMGMGSWVPKPMVTGLLGNQVLLAKDVNTLFTGIDGKALEKRQIPWAVAPEALGFSYPYLLALQTPEKGQLQIRNPETLSLLQTLSVPSANLLHVPQPNISLAHAGKGFLVASERVIWRMNALPYNNQLAELVERQRFDEAVSLLGLLEDTLIDNKNARIREVKMQKATYLFEQQKYRPALDLFVEAEAPPERVVALYPRSVAGDYSMVSESTTEQSEGEQAQQHGTAEQQEISQAGATNKEAPSTPQKGMLSSLKRVQTRNESDAASVKTGVARSDTDNLSIRTSKGTPSKNERRLGETPLEGDDLKMAVRCLCSFLAQARVQIQKFLNTDGTLKQDPPELDADTGKPAFANLLPQHVFESQREEGQQIDFQAELLKTAELVDTTLFKAYMLASPSLAGPLFRLDNFCDPEVVQSSLYESDRYGDLIDFLHGKKLHRQALEMLTKFGKGEADHISEIPRGMQGPERTIAYLKQLPPELFELVLEYVQWPIDEAPEKGMEVFTADTDNADKLPRDKVLRFLGEKSTKLEQEYLEHIINELNDQTSDFHQRLIDLYLEQLKSSSTSTESRDELKTLLEDFLRNSKVYHKAQTFRQLPQDDATFYESRAIVLSAMGNHKQALTIYVFQLQDYAKAEDYCNRTYLAEQASEHDASLVNGSARHENPAMFRRPTSEADDTGAARSNIFATLLGLYLKPPQNEEKRWPQALDLLSRHGARLPASSTLDLMPDDLAVNQMQNYFQGRMRHTTSLLRTEQIVKGLESVRRANTERKCLLGDDKFADMGVKGGRNRRVRITEEDLCKVCHKRFGASAVRVYPDNTVVHYGCAGKKSGEDGRLGSRSVSGRGWA